MRLASVAALAVLVLPWPANPDETLATHTRTRRYDPVRLSYDDLASLIRRVRVQTQAANAGFRAAYRSPSESLEVKQGEGVSFRLRDGFELGSLSNAPREGDALEYSYDYSGAPVSAVDISLSDNWRTVTVRGSSEEQVEAVVAIIESQVTSWETHLRGSDFRRLAGGILLVLSFSLMAIGADLGGAGAVFSNSARNRSLLLGLVGQAAVYVPPWARWMPGVAVLRGDIDPVRRYSAELSIMFGVLSILPISALIRRLVRRPASESGTAEHDQAPGPDCKLDDKGSAPNPERPKPTNR